MIELKFGKWPLKILISNIVKNQTSIKCKKVSFHRGGIKGRTAAREMQLILKLNF